MRNILKFHYSYYDSRLSLSYIKRGLETNLKIYYVEITKYLIRSITFHRSHKGIYVSYSLYQLTWIFNGAIFNTYYVFNIAIHVVIIVVDFFIKYCWELWILIGEIKVKEHEGYTYNSY